jgi:non-canonical purine NTP pyrophosphatase (RdgB/HAM1 family)
MDLYFITGNQGKFEEIQKIIPEIKQLNIDLPEIQGLDSEEILKEKLLAAQKHSNDSFIVEDTSFTLIGMNGLPGPLSKWFLKSIGNEGIVKLSKIFGTQAEAKSLIGYSNEKGEIMFFEGVIPGEIVEITGEASKGFGWDPIFKPEGFDISFGEMEQEEKNKVSMRKIAVEKLKDYLTDL